MDLVPCTAFEVDKDCNDTICIPNYVQNKKILIKPCSVILTKLDLLGHDGIQSTNCCDALSNRNISKVSINNDVDKLKHSSLTNNYLNLSEKEKEYRRKRTDLLFKSLCDTFKLLKAKNEFKEAKKEERKIIFSCISDLEQNGTKKLVGVFFKGKDVITKTCNIHYIPNYKSVQDLPNENLVNDERNNCPKSNISGSSTGSRKDEAVPKSVYSTYQKNNTVSSSPCSMSNISGSSAGSRKDEDVPESVYYLSLKKSNPRSVLKHKLTKPREIFNKKRKIRTEIGKKNKIQKNFKKSVVPFTKKFLCENAVCFSNFNAKCNKSIEFETQIKNVDKKYLCKEKKKYPVINFVGKENSHKTENDCCLEDKHGVRNKEQLLTKFVKNPIVSLKTASFPGNNSLDVTDHTTSSILKAKNCSQHGKRFCSVSNPIISIPNIDSSNCNRNNENTKIPLVFTPCHVLLQDISQLFSADKYSKLVAPLKRQNVLNLKKKFNLLLKKQKLQLLQKKNNFLIQSLKKSIFRKRKNTLLHKRWKMKSKVSKETVESGRKDLQLEDLNLKFCKNVKELSENQHVCNTFPNILPKCHSSIFEIKDCSVVLQRINLDKYLAKSENSLNDQHDSKLNTPSSVLTVCSLSNCRPNNCAIFEKVNADQHDSKLNASSSMLHVCSLRNCRPNNFCAVSEKVNADQHDSKLNASSSVLHVCSLSICRPDNCCFISEKVNADERFVNNRDTLNRKDVKSSKNCIESKLSTKNNFDICQSLESNPNVIKCRRSKRKKGASNVDFRKINKIAANSILKNNNSFNGIEDKDSNLICGSDYKCVQCRKPISNDNELYHHLCCGKRKKGFICDICEKIIGTVHGLKKHLDYHYRFIT